MGKYLKKFETVAQYTAAQSNLILPNVSLITETNSVAYNPTSPAPTYEYVDLGLPSGTLWAKWNVGATSETEHGNYYMYGKGSDDYTVTSGQSAYAGNEEPLAASADTATQVWGSDWHMPTDIQRAELTANTTFEWVTNFNSSGINGAKFTATGESGNYIFIPAAGYYEIGDDYITDADKVLILTSSLMNSYPIYLTAYSGTLSYGNGNRNNGLPIRPVKDGQ